jgi:hypothetical protein
MPGHFLTVDGFGPPTTCIVSFGKSRTPLFVSFQRRLGNLKCWSPRVGANLDWYLDLPERYEAFNFFETIPSRSRFYAPENNLLPWPSACVRRTGLNRAAEASAALLLALHVSLAPDITNGV